MPTHSPQVLIDQVKELPPLPAVAIKIIQAVQDPNASAEDLTRIIALDSALTSKVLRLVNSAYYSFSRRIDSLTQAVVILGFGAVRSLALSVSVVDQMGRETEGFSAKGYWQHAFAVGVAARLIASRAMPTLKEEAFVAGLLHDVGILATATYDPDAAAAVAQYLSQHRDVSRTEAEHLVMGMDHTQVATLLFEHWGMPGGLTDVVGLHHHPEKAKQDPFMVHCVHAADVLVRVLGIGREGDEAATTMDQVSDASLTQLQLKDRRQLLELEGPLRRQMEQAQSFLL